MEYLVFLFVVIVFILIFFISGVWNEKKNFKIYREKLIKNYGTANTREFKEEEFRHVDGYYKKHRNGFSLDDITWDDLNMDDIYKQMNYAKSSAGDEYLYYLLRSPYIKQIDWESFEKKVE